MKQLVFVFTLVSLWLSPQLAAEPCVFEAQLVLPAALEGRRAEFSQVLLQAQRRLLSFARRQDCDHLMLQPLMARAQIFDNKAAFDAHLRRIFQASDQKIPASFVAGFVGGDFFAVTPELYSHNVPQFVEADSYEKLICHELAHRLHIRLVNGNEDKMGPMWFWEGFATYAAGQFEADVTLPTRQEVEQIMARPERGDYRVYNRVFKYFVKLVTPTELVRRAALPGFNEWLLENAAP